MAGKEKSCDEMSQRLIRARVRRARVRRVWNVKYDLLDAIK